MQMARSILLNTDDQALFDRRSSVRVDSAAILRKWNMKSNRQGKVESTLTSLR